ncbi:hypothetical protein [Burkholderia territorii]|uniref:hypothetical protein n=1 Tax=Burkholderia territorii TaxID=1503055 RepID=UPI000B16435B|nr:hypothetical protein [Burkholderia territorii]
MTIEIKVERLFPVMDSLGDLYQQHYDEVYGDTNPYPLDINWEQYKKLDDIGMGLGLFAYYDDIVVGYSINVLTPTLHSKNVMSCTNDVLYVDPVFRDTPLGLRLIKKTEEAAKERGANVVLWYAPLGSTLEKILQKKKYKGWECVFVKDLGG